MNNKHEAAKAVVAVQGFTDEELDEVAKLQRATIDRLMHFNDAERFIPWTPVTTKGFKVDGTPVTYAYINLFDQIYRGNGSRNQALKSEFSSFYFKFKGAVRVNKTAPKDGFIHVELVQNLRAGVPTPDKYWDFSLETTSARAVALSRRQWIQDKFYVNLGEQDLKVSVQSGQISTFSFGISDGKIANTKTSNVTSPNGPSAKFPDIGLAANLEKGAVFLVAHSSIPDTDLASAIELKGVAFDIIKVK